MLRKSHRGATSILNPRYFVSDGFHVMYFESEARTKRHGARRPSKPAPWPPHNERQRCLLCKSPPLTGSGPRTGRFDLRNVLNLRPAADMYNAVEFILAEGTGSCSMSPAGASTAHQGLAPGAGACRPGPFACRPFQLSRSGALRRAFCPSARCPCRA